MTDFTFSASRRALLGCCALAPLACASTSAVPRDGDVPTDRHEFDAELARLEERSGGRLGVFAFSPGSRSFARSSGGVLARRADERFAMCSTFKWLLGAAVLERVDRGLLRLDQPIAYGEADLLAPDPITRPHVHEGQLPLGELCRGTIATSDNTAANLILRELGGAIELTRFLRAHGDAVTRLDREEPELNTNLVGDPRDTTTPRAMATTLSRLLGEDRLSEASRAILATWLIGCETGGARLRGGFPAGWRAGDKTGTGERGATNDVAVLWPESGTPIFVACYLSDSAQSMDELAAIHREVGRLVARGIA